MKSGTSQGEGRCDGNFFGNISISCDNDKNKQEISVQLD